MFIILPFKNITLYAFQLKIDIKHVSTEIYDIT